MAEINVNVGVVVPETPKSIPNEQLSVYVPYASKLGPGIVPYATEDRVGAASFYHVDFDVTEDGQVRIKQSIHNRIDYAVNTIGGKVNELIWDGDAESYTHLELKTNAKQLIPAINENKDSIDALSKDVKDNKDRIGVGTIIDPEPTNNDNKDTKLVRLANWSHSQIVKANGKIEQIETKQASQKETLDDHSVTLDQHTEDISKNESSIEDHDERLNGLSAETIVSVNLNQSNGIMTFTRRNGEKIVIDFPLESVITSIQYDKANNELVLTLNNGETTRVPAKDLITDYLRIEYEGSGNESLTLTMEDQVTYHVVGYNNILLNAPNGDYTSHIIIDFPADVNSCRLTLPVSVNVFGNKLSEIEPGEHWEINVDSRGGALALRKRGLLQ